MSDTRETLGLLTQRKIPIGDLTVRLGDENGIIAWIDQADDDRLRSDNARVLQAVGEAFGSAATGRQNP